ncbi:calcium-binding protein [Azospirillum sp. ST 5-10]|uniref:calcium-binding protein n=1 Tax=unclassified Azospirillum TaxID=2630922 RepID=UPI003F49C387
MARVAVTPLNENSFDNLSTAAVDPVKATILLYATDKIILQETVDGETYVNAYYGSFGGSQYIGGITGTITRIEYDFVDNIPSATVADLTLSWRDLFSGSFSRQDIYIYNDVMYGWSQDDRIAGNSGNDTLYGGNREDALYGNQGLDVLYGDSGADTLFGGQGEDALFGGDSEDLLYGQVAADVMDGGTGTDTLFGGQGADTLSGGDGNDWLFGNRDDDVLAGGSGNDVFVFHATAGNDTILDFNTSAGDRIQLLGNPSYTVATSTGGDAVIRLATGDTLTLKGVAASQVSSDWFIAG